MKTVKELVSNYFFLNQSQTPLKKIIFYFYTQTLKLDKQIQNVVNRNQLWITSFQLPDIVAYQINKELHSKLETDISKTFGTLEYTFFRENEDHITEGYCQNQPMDFNWIGEYALVYTPSGMFFRTKKDLNL